MSHAGVFRPLAAALAVASFVSCSHADVQADFFDAVPSVSEIQIKFSCGTVNSIALTTADNPTKPAWVIKRQQKDPIKWTVPPNVTIKTITGLPLDPDGDQGGSGGKEFKSKVHKNAAAKDYDYVIDATCDPGGGAQPVRLLIDPVMIVH